VRKVERQNALKAEKQSVAQDQKEVAATEPTADAQAEAPATPREAVDSPRVDSPVISSDDSSVQESAASDSPFELVLGGNSTGAVKFGNTFSKLPEDTKNMSVTAQIAFEAYCDSIEEIKELRSIINSMTANQEA
jgi:hypothetical protein